MNTLDHPHYPPPFDNFYPLPLVALQQAQPEWLGFLDVLFAGLERYYEPHPEPSRRGRFYYTLHVHVNQFFDLTGLSRATLNKYLRRAEAAGWIARPDEGRETGYVYATVPPSFFQEQDLLYKPRLYVKQKWVRHRKDLASRQIINAFCYAWTTNYKGRAEPQAMELTVGELRHVLRTVHGAVPDGLRGAVQSWERDRILRPHYVGDELRYRFDALFLLTPAPAGQPLDVLVADVAYRLGLDPGHRWAYVLAKLLLQNHLRWDAVEKLHRILVHNYPELDRPDIMERLWEWLTVQEHGRGSGDYWATAISDFLARYRRNLRRQPLIGRVDEDFSFRNRLAHGQRLHWPPEARWNHVQSAVLVCEFTAGYQWPEEKPQPRLVVYRERRDDGGRGADLIALNTDSVWRRRFQRIPLHGHLPGLRPDEALVITAVMPTTDAHVGVKNVRLHLDAFMSQQLL
ncbi:MAG: hypothetical protein NZP34_03600 [Caldilineales bacterium]|nr:hypothetical protein [Caldilineales bacterium]